MSLIVENLTKSYGNLVAIDDLSTRFDPGHIYGIIGPNGAGKSTLINMTAGSYTVSSGAITLEGRRLDRLKKYQIANGGIGRTYQNIRLFDQMTVLENLEVCFYDRQKAGVVGEVFWPPYGRRREAARREACLEILSFFGLAHLADVEAGSLPYGRQRMLEIARALAQEPQVLLLDEPAAGLNHAETAELTERLSALRSPERIMIVIEHDMDLVMSLCDRVTVLHHGKLLFEGTPDEVKSSIEVQRAYLGTQDDTDEIRNAAQDRRTQLGLRPRKRTH